MIKIAPSILSADFANLGRDIERLSDWKADWIHFDVMDGHFVPNMSFGPVLCSAIRPLTKLPIDVHLMVNEPSRFFDWFVKAGADIITFHAEAEPHIHRSLQHLHERGVKAGVVLNPGTPAVAVKEVLPYCDLLLVMSVNPGFGGQKFIPESLQRLRECVALIGERDIELEIDGGVTTENAAAIREAGATLLVAGTSTFRAPDVREAVRVIAGR